MKMTRPAAALTVAALSLCCAGAHAFGESDATSLCKQYVMGRLQKNDAVEWTGGRWQPMDTPTERRWAVFMDFRTTNGGGMAKPRRAVCQGRYDSISSSWKIVDYSER